MDASSLLQVYGSGFISIFLIIFEFMLEIQFYLVGFLILWSIIALQQVLQRLHLFLHQSNFVGFMVSDPA